MTEQSVNNPVVAINVGAGIGTLGANMTAADVAITMTAALPAWVPAGPAEFRVQIDQEIILVSKTDATHLAVVGGLGGRGLENGSAAAVHGNGAIVYPVLTGGALEAMLAGVGLPAWFQSGAGRPDPGALNVLPTQTGALYQDLTNGGLWVALGATAADWRAIGGNTGGPAQGAGISSNEVETFIMADATGSVEISDQAANASGNHVRWLVGAADGDQAFEGLLGPGGIFNFAFQADGSLYLTDATSAVHGGGAGSALYVTSTAPPNTLGNDGSWCLTIDGHLFHKAAGVWTEAGGGGGPAGGGARAFANAAVAIGAAAETAVAFTGTRDDSDVFFAIGTPTRLTVPAGKAGRYTIAGTAEWAASALGTLRRLSLRLNGATYIAKNEITSIINAALPQAVSTVYDLADGDYVELVAFQDTIGAVNLNSAGNYSPELALMAAGGPSSGGGGTQRPLVDPTGLAWAWFNQGVANVATQGAALLLSSPAEAADNWHFRGKAVPALDYTIIAHLLPGVLDANYVGIGVGWLQTSDNHFAVFGEQGGTRTLTSSYSTAPWALTNNYMFVATNGWWEWVKLTDAAAGNRQISVSRDGYNWVLLHSVAHNAQITPDRVIFGVQSRSAWPVALTLDSWEEF